MDTLINEKPHNNDREVYLVFNGDSKTPLLVYIRKVPPSGNSEETVGETVECPLSVSKVPGPETHKGNA